MNTNSTKYFSNKQEKRVSKAVNGKTVIGSGATPFMKGDVTSDDILYECKTNIKGQDSISVRREWFEKVKVQAYEMGKYMYSVVFSFGKGTDYYCMETEHFRILLEGHEKFNEIMVVLDESNLSDADRVGKISEIVRRKY